MRKYLAALGVFLLLCGCTEESKVKKVAVEAAQAQFQAEIREELAKAVQGKPYLQSTAVKILTSRTDFEVQKVDIQGNQATVLVQLLTVPPKVRVALAEIMEKLESNRIDRFNVANAIQLIQQQMGIPQTRTLLTYELKLQKRDGWELVAEKKPPQ